MLSRRYPAAERAELGGATIGTSGRAAAHMATRAGGGSPNEQPWQPTKDAVEQAAAASIGLGLVGPLAAVP